MSRPYRRELKFLVHHSVKLMLLERWRRYLVRAPFTNEHALTPILSQYYDSPDLTFYYEKLDGIRLRNKVRLRVYDLRFRPGATAFLEIKHRLDDLLKKFRYRIDDFHPRFLDPAEWDFHGAEDEPLFRILLERFHLRPSAQVYYQREAYEGIVESDVRITFDTNLIGLHPGEVLTRGLMHSRSRNLMPETVVILEVKATNGVPRWVHEGIVALELEQKTIPKYITAVEFLDLPELYGAGLYT